MVGIAQLVRALDCGSRGRGFDSHYSPHILATQPSGKAEDCNSFIIGSNPVVASSLSSSDSVIHWSFLFFIHIDFFYEYHYNGIVQYIFISHPQLRGQSCSFLNCESEVRILLDAPIIQTIRQMFPNHFHLSYRFL